MLVIESAQITLKHQRQGMGCLSSFPKYPQTKEFGDV